MASIFGNSCTIHILGYHIHPHGISSGGKKPHVHILLGNCTLDALQDGKSNGIVEDKRQFVRVIGMFQVILELSNSIDVYQNKVFPHRMNTLINHSHNQIKH
jgi:hypothetical protein